MRFLNEFCGEAFYIWNGKSLGRCFTEIFLIYPTNILLLILSSYYLGVKSQRIIFRPKFEKIIVYIRIFFSTFLSCLSIYQVIFYKSSPESAGSALIQIIIEAFAWVFHAVYSTKFLHGISVNIRGPIVIRISVMFCFVATILTYYFKYHMRFDIISVLFLMAQGLYICTFLPPSKISEFLWTQNINTTDDEQEPILNTALSRYRFSEENCQDLGAAEDANVFSKLLFLWVQPLMMKGYNKNLNSVADLYDLPNSLQSINISSRLVSHSHLNFGSNAFVNNENVRIETSLLKDLHSRFSWEFYSIGILKFLSDSFSFGGPILLNSLVTFLESDEKFSKNGYYYALGLFGVTVFSALSSVHYNYFISRVSFKIKSYLIMSVYQKTLDLNKVILSNHNSGEILNFISTDTDRIVNFCQSFHQFWSLPVQIIIALVLLYEQISYCFAIGVTFMIAIIPINQYIAKSIGRYSTLMMLAKDKRIKIMNEIISGIRIIKMNTWEPLFSNKLKTIRQIEMNYLKKRKYLDALCVYFWASTPVLMTFLTFTVYAILGYNLTAAKVFTSIALFNILIMPLNAFPWVLNGLVEAWISVKRVNSFLQLQNFDSSTYYFDPDDADIALKIENGAFEYSSNTLISAKIVSSSSSESPNVNLGPLSLKVKKGEFLCIIGRVGSGKSSVLSSILGDMTCTSGKVIIEMAAKQLGIGYVSQVPWIQQKTIKDNILFGKTLNILKYRKVLEACALLEDLESLPHGDMTEIGEKGATLSGGQKARIALARAVYQDFDIYLLDDSLSSVDIHVADFIYAHCIMGILKEKTRILCTHKIEFAESADQLMILSGGKVSNQGPPRQILQFYSLKDEIQTSSEESKLFYQSNAEALEQNEGVPSLMQKEEKEEGTVKLHVYKAYWVSIGSALSFAVLLFCFLMQASKTIADWWLSYWISSVNQKNSTYFISTENFPNNNQDDKSLIFYLSIYGGLAAANSVFTFFRAFLFAMAGIKAAIILHDRIVRNVMKATSSFFDITPLGRIMNRFSSDVYCVDDSLPFIMNILLAQLFSLMGCIVITCYGLPWIIVCIILLSIAYFRLQRYYRFTSRELKRLSSITLSPIYAHFSETLQGQPTIRAMSGSSRFQRENMECVDSNLRACLAMSAASQWLNLRLQLIGVVIVTAVAISALVQKEFGTVDPGLVGLALSYALSVTSLLNGSITSFTETEKEIVSVERIMQYIEGVTTENEGFIQMPPFAWPSHGVIAFTNVSLRYHPSCPHSLKNVSFETKPGEKIGVVGRTGAGKSSLIQALYRMCDSYEGQICIDGTNIKNIALNKLRSSITVIPQEPFLYSGTIRENVDPCFLKTDSQIWSALRSCHMEDKLYEMGGLNVEVDECGNNLSIGEKQLLCLARALLRKTKILCMDEATASIDFETDSLIRHTVRMAFRRSTILVIAHRVETILDCDRVIVMKDGAIIEINKPSILLSNTNSEFYKLVYSKESD